MKYVIVLGDGMADEPIEALGGKTPLEYANTPVMDELASGGEMGMTQNVPAGMHPGSEVANLAVMGYDPEVYFTGRSPMEALSVGVQMEDTDIIFRANVVTLSEEEPYDQKTLIDHSASEIETADTDILMDAIREAFNSEEIQFYTGTSYRNICVWKGGHLVDIDPPHDHLGQKVTELLPTEKLFRDMMEKSFDILNNHPLNIERAKKGLNKANSLWFWGAGTKPSFDGFRSTILASTPLATTSESSPHKDLMRGSRTHDEVMNRLDRQPTRSLSSPSMNPFPENRWPTGVSLPSRPISPRSAPEAVTYPSFLYALMRLRHSLSSIGMAGST